MLNKNEFNLHINAILFYIYGIINFQYFSTMSNKQLIISLIQQDLKHSQLVSGLDNLGLEATENHCLQLLDIIAKLMGVPEGNAEFDWGKMYVSLMAESIHFDIRATSDDLRPYAKVCYVELKKLLDSFHRN